MSNFTIRIIAKPYVKKFIMNNCGHPADLRKLPELNRYFRRRLAKPTKRWDYKYQEAINGYSEVLEIRISDEDFYHYGWEMSRTGVIDFGKDVEYYIKMIMRTYIAFMYAIGIPIKEAINNFQDQFDLPESFWSYEAIKKDFYRNGTHITLNFKNLITSTLEKIFLENLSLNGTYRNLTHFTHASA